MTRTGMTSSSTRETQAFEQDRSNRSYEISSDLVMLSSNRQAEAEAIRTIRTHVTARHLHGGRRGLAMCAAAGGSGCTFTSVNLAVALSQIGVSTLLIDADLRTPSVEEFIRPNAPATGLRQMIAAGEHDLYAGIHAEILPNLSVLFSGGRAESPQELLGSEEFKDIIEQCLRDFSFTIVDCPPAKRYADARRISSLVGYGIIVARRDNTFVNDVSALAAQMQEDGVQVVGTVLNEF